MELGTSAEDIYNLFAQLKKRAERLEGQWGQRLVYGDQICGHWRVTLPVWKGTIIVPASAYAMVLYA